MASSMKDARWCLASKILLELTGEDLGSESLDYEKRTAALNGAQRFLEVIPDAKVEELAQEWNGDPEVLSWTDAERRNATQEANLS